MSKEKEIAFICPECKAKDQLCFIRKGVITSEPVCIQEASNGGICMDFFDSGLIEDIYEDSYFHCYECGSCGYQVKHDNEIYVQESEIVEWIKKNC
jgi:hypothetical protein